MHDRKAPEAAAANPNLNPPALDPQGPNLICFPYAGAGSSAFRHWRAVLPALAISYPEKAESVDDMVRSLMRHVAPGLRGRFAFFGHSMGAGIAFEFTRMLRQAGLPLPAALIVSAATAPQLRTAALPDLSDDELLETLSRIHGRSASDKMLRIILTRFAPDARLHRRYQYAEEPPLDIPIRAYGGRDDTTVPLARLEPWEAQTTAGFRLRLFSGGHMYLEDPATGLLAALREDLNELLPS